MVMSCCTKGSDASKILVLQAAIEYLVEDLPVGKNKDNVGFMYNIILSSALYHKKPDIIIRVLDLMSENSIPRSAHTWVLVFNSLVRVASC